MRADFEIQVDQVVFFLYIIKLNKDVLVEEISVTHVVKITFLWCTDLQLLFNNLVYQRDSPLIVTTFGSYIRQVPSVPDYASTVRVFIVI